MTLNPLGAALTLSDDGIFLLELLGGLGKGLFGLYQPGCQLAAKPENRSSANALACASPVSLVLVRYWMPFRDAEQCQVSPLRR